MDTHTAPPLSLQVVFHSHCLFLIQNKQDYFVVSFGMVFLEQLLDVGGLGSVVDYFYNLGDSLVGLALLSANADGDWLLNVLQSECLHFLRPGG